MLLVHARVGPSLIHGNGLVSQQFIPSGTRVWQFQPGLDVIIPNSFYQSLPHATQQQIFYWSYYHPSTKCYVMSSDDDRFTKHSSNPNTKVAGDCTMAADDIHAGEEITNDYEELQFLDYHSSSSDSLRATGFRPGVLRSAFLKRRRNFASELFRFTALSNR